MLIIITMSYLSYYMWGFIFMLYNLLFEPISTDVTVVTPRLSTPLYTPHDLQSSTKTSHSPSRPRSTSLATKYMAIDLNKLVLWSKEWLLPFNTDKCNILHYGKTTPILNII